MVPGICQIVYKRIVCGMMQPKAIQGVSIQNDGFNGLCIKAAYIDRASLSI